LGARDRKRNTRDARAPRPPSVDIATSSACVAAAMVASRAAHRIPAAGAISFIRLVGWATPPTCPTPGEDRGARELGGVS